MTSFPGKSVQSPIPKISSRYDPKNIKSQMPNFTINYIQVERIIILEDETSDVAEYDFAVWAT